MVIAGAGTGKTRVIVERVRQLLETQRRTSLPGAAPRPDLQRQGGQGAPARGSSRPSASATRARMTVSNFHSFCQRILTENAADAGLPPRPGRARRRRPGPPAQGPPAGPPPRLPRRPSGGSARSSSSSTGPRTSWSRPADFDAFVAEERRVFEDALRQLRGRRRPARRQGQPASRSARSASAYAWRPRATSAPRPAARRREYDPRWPSRRPPTARPAARSPATASAHPRSWFAADDQPRIDELADTYVADGAALEVLRLTELAPVYRAYEAELARRGALDFGEQIAAVTQLFKTRPERPAPLAAPVPLPPRRRVPGRQRRPDRAHRAARPDAGPARQRHGRRRRRPVDLPLPGRQLRRLRRVRRALRAAAGARPDAPPPGPPTRLRLEQNFRSRRARPDRRQPADRAATRPASSRTSACVTEREDGRPVELLVCAGPEDEAVAIVDAIKARPRRRHRQAAGRTSPSCTASTSTATRSSPGCATRTSRTPSSAGCRCSRRPRSATSSRPCGRSPTRRTTSPSSG